MRLIDADALQRRICGANCGCEYEDCGCEGDCTFDHFIFHAPTIDPESLRPKWISVEDRLPEDWCPVLVAMDDVAQPRVGCYEKIHAMWWRDSGGVPIRRTATHWMPLPEPPAADMRGET